RSAILPSRPAGAPHEARKASGQLVPRECVDRESGQRRGTRFEETDQIGGWSRLRSDIGARSQGRDQAAEDAEALGGRAEEGQQRDDRADGRVVGQGATREGESGQAEQSRAGEEARSGRAL